MHIVPRASLMAIKVEKKRNYSLISITEFVSEVRLIKLLHDKIIRLSDLNQTQWNIRLCVTQQACYLYRTHMLAITFPTYTQHTHILAKQQTTPPTQPNLPTFYFCGHDFNLYFRFIYTRVEKQRAVTIPKQVEKITFPSRQGKKQCYLYSNFIAVPFIYMLFMYRNATQFRTTSVYMSRGRVIFEGKKVHTYSQKHPQNTHVLL